MAAVVRVAAESSLASGAVNVWHYRIPNIDLDDEVGEVLDAIKAFYDALATWLVTQTWTIGERVVTVDLNPNQIAASAARTSTSSGTGEEGLSLAGVLQLKTYTVGGSFRGRKYIGPLEDGVVATGGRQIGSTTRAAIISAATSLLTPTAAGCQLVIWSKTLEQATTVAGVSCASVLGSVRRRLR